MSLYFQNLFLFLMLNITTTSYDNKNLHTVLTLLLCLGKLGATVISHEVLEPPMHKLRLIICMHTVIIWHTLENCRPTYGQGRHFRFFFGVWGGGGRDGLPSEVSLISWGVRRGRSGCKSP